MDEGPVISTDVQLALIFYAPTSKNLKNLGGGGGSILCLLCSLFRSFYFFTGA